MNTLTLHSGALRCELVPELGGCIAGLWWGQQQVLRSTPPDQLRSALDAASYPLVPYSNRIGQRQLQWAGKTYTLAPNFAPEPHTIHGVGWQRAWRVASSSASQAVLEYGHQADAAWPFAFDSRQTLTLNEHALELHLSITNRAPEAAPAGLGWHPYFAKSAQTRLCFASTARWEMGQDKLPTERRTHAGLDTDCASLDIDHCFEGWTGALRLTEGGLHLRVTSDLHCLVVFTTPERDSIAIEPVSHVNNALGLAQHSGQSAAALGMRTLQPGETVSAHMRIALETAA